MNKKIIIAGSCRTAIGKMSGMLSTVPVAKLGEVVIREAVRRAGIQPADVDMVYMGCVLQAAQGQNVTRQAAVNAGIPVESPAITINVVCGSGLEAVNMAARMVLLGEADVVVAGGMENMSAAAYALPLARAGYRLGDGKLVDTMVNDGLTDAFSQLHMGITAENVAEQWHLTRQELDEFSAISQQKAAKAQADGKFVEEIVPVQIRIKRDVIDFVEDEGIRGDATADGLAKLKPAFKPDGVVTAGNASTINDGAAAVVVMSEEKARELGVTPEAIWLGSALEGVEPSIMGIGPVAATKKLLEKLGITIADFDVIEANEAFAAQSVAVLRDLGMDPDKVNVNGGAIALGHPIGASGCRILVSLIHEMKRQESAKLGLATLCIGGGMGCATAIAKPEA
ncbi:MAG TPA: acetyl-CoA C-acetyltransferase [Anaerolineaceae bacterium]|nr:acetyl-CoA C-acetyltransferase [Anaerolineaceae bacterium]